MSKVDRSVLRDLVNKWARGELDERSVHEEAEALYEQLEPLPEYPPEDARSIPIEVLSHLEILNHQLIVREDIPAILDFLETHPGKELEAWSQWEAYWNTLDYDERMERLRDNPYYSSLPVKRKSKKAP